MNISTNKKGALPNHLIREMFGVAISGADESNIKPASLDLTLSDEIYEVKGALKPRLDERVEDVLKIIKNHKHPLNESLHKGKVYLARLNESVALPKSVYAYANPKSSTGRLDIHIRLIADKTSRYDKVDIGAQSNLWAVIIPHSFECLVHAGISLNQLRFFNHDTRLSESELEIEMMRHRLVWNPVSFGPMDYRTLPHSDNDGMVNLSLDLSGKVLGYKAKDTEEVVELSKVGAHKASDFFENIEKEEDIVRFKKGAFYILSSFEAIRVPSHLACEMIPVHERYGEFRSHYAGFIDPGWGWGQKGEGKGRQLTLEVRPSEDIIARNNDPFAKIYFEHLVGLPDIVYDSISSNYSNQSGPVLGKHFFNDLV